MSFKPSFITTPSEKPSLASGAGIPPVCCSLMTSLFASIIRDKIPEGRDYLSPDPEREELLPHPAHGPIHEIEFPE